MDSLEDYVELLYEGKDKVRGKIYFSRKIPVYVGSMSYTKKMIQLLL